MPLIGTISNTCMEQRVDSVILLFSYQHTRLRYTCIHGNFKRRNIRYLQTPMTSSCLTSNIILVLKFVSLRNRPRPPTSTFIFNNVQSMFYYFTAIPFRLSLLITQVRREVHYYSDRFIHFIPFNVYFCEVVVSCPRFGCIYKFLWLSSKLYNWLTCLNICSM